jgi:hypothetical protein
MRPPEIRGCALLVVLVKGLLPTGATAQGLLTYHVILEQPAPSLPLVVGIDDGSGFLFATLMDDDGDGLIELPRVPVPGRLALGATPVGGALPGCDIWDFSSNSVSRASVPLFVNAVANESIGIDFGELMAPPRTFMPGERYNVSDGIFVFTGGWPGVRLVDELGVAGLEEFVREVDSLPNFNGEVIVSDTIVHFTLVPEPSSVALVTIGLVAIGILQRRRNRCSSGGTN